MHTWQNCTQHLLATGKTNPKPLLPFKSFLPKRLPSSSRHVNPFSESFLLQEVPCPFPFWVVTWPHYSKKVFCYGDVPSMQPRPSTTQRQLTARYCHLVVMCFFLDQPPNLATHQDSTQWGGGGAEQGERNNSPVENLDAIRKENRD